MSDYYFKSPDTYRRIMSTESVTTVDHDICANGCYMYPADSPQIMFCPVAGCGLPRYKNAAAVQLATSNAERDPEMPLPTLIAERTMAYTSIGKALTQRFTNNDRAEMLQYRKHFFDNSTLNRQYRDIFSGASFKRLLEEGVVDDETICLLIFVDGYQPKHVQKAQQVMITCLVMNIDPESR